MEERWYEIIDEIDDFMYGNDGIVTIANTDRSLKKYVWNFDRINAIIAMINEFKNKYSSLSDEQLKQLEVYKDSFIKLNNSDNNVIQVYDEIMAKIYKTGDI